MARYGLSSANRYGIDKLYDDDKQRVPWSNTGKGIGPGFRDGWNMVNTVKDAYQDSEATKAGTEASAETSYGSVAKGLEDPDDPRFKDATPEQRQQAAGLYREAADKGEKYFLSGDQEGRDKPASVADKQEARYGAMANFYRQSGNAKKAEQWEDRYAQVKERAKRDELFDMQIEEARAAKDTGVRMRGYGEEYRNARTGSPSQVFGSVNKMYDGNSGLAGQGEHAGQKARHVMNPDKKSATFWFEKDGKPVGTPQTLTLDQAKGLIDENYWHKMGSEKPELALQHKKLVQEDAYQNKMLDFKKKEAVLTAQFRGATAGAQKEHYAAQIAQARASEAKWEKMYGPDTAKNKELTYDLERRQKADEKADKVRANPDLTTAQKNDQLRNIYAGIKGASLGAAPNGLSAPSLSDVTKATESVRERLTSTAGFQKLSPEDQEAEVVKGVASMLKIRAATVTKVLAGAGDGGNTSSFEKREQQGRGEEAANKANSPEARAARGLGDRAETFNRGDAEATDPELRRLRFLTSSKDPNISTNAYADYSRRLEQLEREAREPSL